MKRISPVDVHQGIQYLYEQDLLFGQRFIYVRGNGKATGVEEKINIFLNWLPLSKTQEIPDSGPKWIPVSKQVNNKEVIQESHHSAVAFAIMKIKNYYHMKLLPTEPRNSNCAYKTNFIFIIEKHRWHITVLRNDRWDLFSQPIIEPAMRYWSTTNHDISDYKKSLDPHSELALWLPD